MCGRQGCVTSRKGMFRTCAKGANVVSEASLGKGGARGEAHICLCCHSFPDTDVHSGRSGQAEQVWQLLLADCKGAEIDLRCTLHSQCNRAAVALS